MHNVIARNLTHLVVAGRCALDAALELYDAGRTENPDTFSQSTRNMMESVRAERAAASKSALMTGVNSVNPVFPKKLPATFVTEKPALQAPSFKKPVIAGLVPPKPVPVPPKPGQLLTDETAAGLRDGTVDMAILGRVQLVDVAQALGCTSEETRGKHIKSLREMITAKLEVEAAEPHVYPFPPAKQLTLPVGPPKFAKPFPRKLVKPA